MKLLFLFALVCVYITRSDAKPQQQQGEDSSRASVRPQFMKTPYKANSVSATCHGHFSQYFLWPSVSGDSNVVTSASLDIKTDANAFVYANDVVANISFLGGGIWPGQYITPNGTFFHYPAWNACFWLPGWDLAYEAYRKTTATFVGYQGGAAAADDEARGGRIGIFAGNVGDPGNGPKNINFRAEVDLHAGVPTLVTYSQVAPKYYSQPVGNPMYVEGQVLFEECTLGAPASTLITLPSACTQTNALYMCPGAAAYAPCLTSPFYVDNEYVPNPYAIVTASSSKRSGLHGLTWEQRQALLEKSVKQLQQGPNYTRGASEN